MGVVDVVDDFGVNYVIIVVYFFVYVGWIDGFEVVGLVVVGIEFGI